MATQILINGEVNFETVPEIWSNTFKNFQESIDVQIDFSGVLSCNSAAIALLIEWINIARIKQKKLLFIHIPDRMMVLAAACGIRQEIEAFI